MKRIKITIVGDIIGVNYCNKELAEQDDFINNYYTTTGWDKVDGLYIDVPDGTFDFDGYFNAVKSKGKYVKTRHFFHSLFAEEGDHPLPVEVHTRIWQNQDISYFIELEDDEEFDIKKVQLIKSDYEVDAFPYFILATRILYDSREIEWEEDPCYDPEMKMYGEFVIDEFMY